MSSPCHTACLGPVDRRRYEGRRWTISRPTPPGTPRPADRAAQELGLAGAHPGPRRLRGAGEARREAGLMAARQGRVEPAQVPALGLLAGAAPRARPQALRGRPVGQQPGHAGWKGEVEGRHVPDRRAGHPPEVRAPRGGGAAEGPVEDRSGLGPAEPRQLSRYRVCADADRQREAPDAVSGGKLPLDVGVPQVVGRLVGRRHAPRVLSGPSASSFLCKESTRFLLVEGHPTFTHSAIRSSSPSLEQSQVLTVQCGHSVRSAAQVLRVPRAPFAYRLKRRAEGAEDGRRHRRGGLCGP